MTISIVAGNWKMNTTLREATSLVSEMKPRLDDAQGVRKVVCPPFVSLASVADLLRGSTISVGAQNMHHEDSGAYTGEVSPLMAAELCEYVVLGHSERRQHFGETDESVNLKVKAANRVGLKPILCVGERLDERDEGRAEALVERQLRGGLEGEDSVSGLVVAYEPVWAIGTGRAATPDVAQDMMAHIRSVLTSLYGGSTASDVPLLYGGSVNAANATDYMKESDIDGALVGGASLDADSFVEIVRAAAEARP
jgi:triosephosphate isomerase